FVRKRLEDELAEVRSDRPRLGRSRSGALREEQKDGDARRARRDEPEKLERCRVGEMQVLEDVKEGPLACERSDDVVDDDEHRALPFVGIARGLGRPGKMEELRKGRGDELRRGEVEVAQLLGE